MKILYAGGGTMGSVSPLVAIHQQLKFCRDEARLSTGQTSLPRLYKHEQQITEYQCLWLGTTSGMERELVEKSGIRFEPITSGKLRRYFALENILDIFRIIIGFFQALYWLIKFSPDIVLTAGSFVAVPVAYAAFFYNVPIFAHQQDVRVGLANKLIALVAKKITVALPFSPLLNKEGWQTSEARLTGWLIKYFFNPKKTVLVGNPVRQFLNSVRSSLFTPPLAGRAGAGMHSASSQPVCRRGRETGGNNKNNFKFQNNLPIVLIMGGGTGALAINELVWQSLPELTKFCNVIHIAGKNKLNDNYSLPASPAGRIITHYSSHYQSFEFLGENIFKVMESADIVVSRAGMSTLTELAYFKKPTIIIPIPDSHQEDNAEYFAEKNSALYLSQNNLTKDKFVETIKNLLADEIKKKEIGENMNQIFVDYSGEKYLSVILNEVKKLC